MQFCLLGSNNVLHGFFPEVFLLFEILLYVCEKHIFLGASSGDPLLNEKQKKPFVSLNHGVTIIHESLTTASLAQVDKALNGLDWSLFCPDAGSIRGQGRFVLFLYFFQKPRYLFIFVSL